MLLHIVLRPPRPSFLSQGKEAGPSSSGLFDFQSGEGIYREADMNLCGWGEKLDVRLGPVSREAG